VQPHAGPEKAGSAGGSTRFSGKRQPILTKTCACGCGERFKTHFVNQKFLNSRHRDRYYRRK
jgi:hypothetical protein